MGPCRGLYEWDPAEEGAQFMDIRILGIVVLSRGRVMIGTLVTCGVFMTRSESSAKEMDCLC